MKTPKQKEGTKDKGKNKIICRNLSLIQWSGCHALCFISTLANDVGLPAATENAKTSDEKA